MTVPTEKSKRIIASTYLEPDEYEALKGRARGENRAISAQIRHLIQQWLKTKAAA